MTLYKYGKLWLVFNSMCVVMYTLIFMVELITDSKQFSEQKFAAPYIMVLLSHMFCVCQYIMAMFQIEYPRLLEKNKQHTTGISIDTGKKHTLELVIPYGTRIF